TGGVMLQGVLSAVAPFAAQSLGAGDRRAAGRIAGAGVVLAVLLAVAFIVILTILDRLLPALGYDARLAGEMRRYVRAICRVSPAIRVGSAGLSRLCGVVGAVRRTVADTFGDGGGGGLRRQQCGAELGADLWSSGRAGARYAGIRLCERDQSLADVRGFGAVR